MLLLQLLYILQKKKKALSKVAYFFEDQLPCRFHLTSTCVSHVLITDYRELRITQLRYSLVA